jgi:hypothetical protein
VRAWCPRGEEQRWGGGGVGLQLLLLLLSERQHWCSTL